MRGIGLILIALGVGLGASSLSLAKGPGMAGGMIFRFGPDLSNWRHVTFPRRPGAVFKSQDAATLVVQTKAGVGLLWRPVPAWASAASKARWRWRVTHGVGSTDLTKRGGDDRALAVYFAFAEKGADGSDLMNLLRQERGYVLIYVWGGAARPGMMLPLPYFNGRGRTVVKRSADTPNGVWFNEEADIRGDFRRAFGNSAGTLVAVAVSSDSDDTGDSNLAALADLCIK